MTTHTELRGVLQQAGASIPEDHPQLEEVVRRGRHRRYRYRGSFAATVAVLVVAVAGVALDLPGATPFVSQAPTDRDDVVIYLCGNAPIGDGAGPDCEGPATEADISRLRTALALDEAVLDVRYETPEGAHERFSELFAEQPELLESVPPSALPASLRLTLTDDADVDNVIGHYRRFDGVEAVTTHDAG